MVETNFRQQLPAHGMAVREGQIKLCHAMLDALYNKEVALCDAGVGLGKTYAYLVACLLWQSQRPRALWQPVVISTPAWPCRRPSCKSTFRFCRPCYYNVDI